MNIRGYFWENPVLVASNRASFRKGRLFVFVGIGVILLAIGVMMPLYLGDLTSTTSRFVFFGISVGAGILLVMIALNSTHQVIIKEREAMTFEVLTLTGLKSEAIVLGYLMSSMSLTGILILASLPLISMFIFFGGVSIAELMVSVLAILSLSAFAGILGLYSSAVAKKSRRSSSAVIVAGFMFLGLVLIGSISDMVSGGGGPVSLFPDISAWRWVLITAWTLGVFGSCFLCLFFATSRRVRDLRGDPSKRLRLTFLVFFGLWIALFTYFAWVKGTQPPSMYGAKDTLVSLCVFAIVSLGLFAVIVPTSPTRHLQKLFDFKNIFNSWSSSGLGYLAILIGMAAIPPLVFALLYSMNSFGVVVDMLPDFLIAYVHITTFALALFTLGRLGQIALPTQMITRALLFFLVAAGNIAVVTCVNISYPKYPGLVAAIKHGFSFLAPLHITYSRFDSHPELFVSGITGGLMVFGLGHVLLRVLIAKKGNQAAYLYVPKKRRKKQALTTEPAA